MLKGIPAIISPELLKVLSEMGHGDEIVIADGNFPAASVAKTNNNILLRADGHGVVELLKAILVVMPLDTYTTPVHIMEKVPGDPVATPIWDEFQNAIKEHTDKEMGTIERFAFYERAKTAYAVISTSEKALYGNIILKKGVV